MPTHRQHNTPTTDIRVARKSLCTSYRDLDPAVMMTPIVTEIRRNGNPVGERVELGRYRIPAGERIVYGQRVDGVVRVTDVPAQGGGRAYLVERELEQDGYDALLALVADYVGQAELYGAIPMTAPAERWLDHIDDTVDC